MRKSLLVLVVTTLFLFPTLAQAVVVPPIVSTDRAECRTAQSGVAPGVTEQVLTGERARDHLRNLMARHPKVFAEARRQMLANGYSPTTVVTVRRTVRSDLIHDQSPHRPVDPRLAQSYSSSEGEITFWSWDDGDDSTWEGTVHVSRYSDGVWRTINGQSYIGNENYSGIWSQLVGEWSPPEEEFQSEWNSASPDGTVRFADWDGSHEPEYRLAFLEEFDWDGYWICVTARCGAACPTLCAFAGPFWGYCYGGCCVGTGLIGCAIEQLL